MTFQQERAGRIDQRVTAILDRFNAGFEEVLRRAQARAISRLREKLAVDDGELKATPANVRVMKQLPTIFRDSLNDEGYDALVQRFTSEFDGGLPEFSAILEHIGAKLGASIGDFNASDVAYFDAIKMGATLSLDDAMDNVAALARQHAMYTLGGSSFEDLSVLLAERLHVALGEASTIAATGISTFYRTVADRGFEKAEDAVKSATGRDLEYEYYGPPAGDKLIRPFCARLMKMTAAGRTWTRKQIEAMDNGQLPNVFQTGGGYNCRHQWVVALEDESKHPRDENGKFV